MKLKVFRTVAEAVADRFFEAKLNFFIAAAENSEPFIKNFQSETPMAPFSYDDLTELLRIMMSKVMKPAAMKGKSNALIQISLDDDNVLSAANVDIGFSTKSAL